MVTAADDLFGLKFDAGKSIRYHSHLRAGWTRADHWNKVLTLFLGGAVVVSVLSKARLAELTTAAFTSLASATDIVFGFSDKARLHDDFYKRWHDYLEMIEVLDEDAVSDEEVRRFRIRRLKIERDEPDVLRVMERQASSEECKARGCVARPEWRLNWLERRLCALIG